nr:FAD:protein FMN transferase [Paenibacillus sp. MMS18-CY102]
MNTAIELSLVCTVDAMEKSIALAEDWFEEVERLFSRFRRDSELCRINQANGAPVLVSTLMLDLLQLSEQYRRQTSGIFSPYVGRQLVEAGYDRSFEQLEQLKEFTVDGIGDRNGSQARDSNPEPINLVPSPLQLDMGMRAVTLEAGVQLDFGGIAKSWATQQLARWLRTHYDISTGLVNAGGDLEAWHHEHHAEGPRWQLNVDMPLMASDGAILQRVNNGSMATSGMHRRRWLTQQGAKHHLIHPLTGRPSASDVVQCTVSGENLIDCEIWAKTICIVGKQLGLAMLQERAPAYEALLVDKAGLLTWHGTGWNKAMATKVGG